MHTTPSNPPQAARTVTPGPVPDLAAYDVIAVSDSGGKDSHAALAATVEAAATADVPERVFTFHASLGPLEWPAVDFRGRRFPSVSELAATHSAAYGIPPERHRQLQRTAENAAGELVPYSLLTYIAERGKWPASGLQFCTSDWKTARIFAAFTPLVKTLRPGLGRPVRILNVLGLRAEESPRRAKRPAYRLRLANGSRHVDEWLPVHSWTTTAVRDFCAASGIAHHWAYDSVPGAGDWLGSSRCSCSVCILANRRDLTLAVRRRPRLAALYAEVEQVRRHRFRNDLSMAELLDLATRPGGPAPGVVLPDDDAAFTAMAAAVRGALSRPPRPPRRRTVAKASQQPAVGCSC